MPKKSATLNDFSGGINSSSDARDLGPNEFDSLICLDPHQAGKLIPTGQFKAGVFADQSNWLKGYGMFVFSNDYEFDNTAGYNGFFLANTSSGGQVYLYQSEEATGWKGPALTGVNGTNPMFYSAEGDLFCGGDVVTPPKAFIRVDREDFNNSIGGDTNLGRSIGFWGQITQHKPAPTADTQQIFWANGDYNAGADSALDVSSADVTTIADELVWAIEWNDTADTGTWINTGDYSTGAHITFASSWLYKNGAESDLYVLSPGDYVGANLPTTSNKNAEDISLKVHALMESANTTGGTAATELYRYGARLYAKMDDEAEYFLLAEVDYEKGIIGDGETDFSSWADTILGAEIGASTGFIRNPPAVYSYYANNGYSTSDIPLSSRVVNWKVGVVINSRAYIGNVKINGRIYGDRIFKSPPFQYDVFTENQWIESAPNDGDQITAMATYADRILMFKKKSVTIINVSKVDEYVEDQLVGAGVEWPASVTTTHNGVAWASKAGCFLYDGERIRNLLEVETKLGKVQKLLDSHWEENVENDCVVGFVPTTRQLLIVWDADDGRYAFIFSFDTNSWTVSFDLMTSDTAHISNMVNVRSSSATAHYDLLVGGGAHAADVNYFVSRATAETVSTDAVLRTAELNFGNYESKKNLLKIVITYQGGASQAMLVTAFVDGSAGTGGTETGTLGTMDGGAGRQTLSIDLTGDSRFQGLKTVQIELDGPIAFGFALEDITFIYRELGVH